MDCAVWIQAIATCVLVILTGFYAWFTRRLVEVGNTTFLNVVRFADMGGDYQVTIKNGGAGIAIDVKVYLSLNSLKKQLEGEKDTSEVVQAIGHNVIPINEEKTFSFNSPGYRKGDGTFPIFVIYKTLANKQFMYEWEAGLSKSPYMRLVKQHKKIYL